jgi:hypothetical protein
LTQSDLEPPAVRGTAGRVALSIAAVVAPAPPLWYLGVAGYRGGFVICAASLAGGGAAVALIVLRRVPQKTMWTVTVAILAVVVSAVLVDRAPVSKGSLARAMDGLHLQYYEQTAERRTGNSRCSPQCPAVTRIYRGPDVNVEPAVIEVGSRLAAAGYPVTLSVENRRSGHLRSSRGRIEAEVTVTRDAQHTTVEITFGSKR